MAIEWMLEHIELTTGYIERYSFGISMVYDAVLTIFLCCWCLVCVWYLGPGVVYITLFMLNLQHM